MSRYSPLLRARVLAASRDALAAGQRPSVQALRARGVRGGTALLIMIRDELIAAGELPPESRRAYTRTSSCPPRGKAQALPGRLRPSPPVPDPPRPSRRMRRAITAYYHAVRRIFGAARAARIGAAPAGRKTKNRT